MSVIVNLITKIFQNSKLPYEVINGSARNTVLEQLQSSLFYLLTIRNFQDIIKTLAFHVVAPIEINLL